MRHPLPASVVAVMLLAWGFAALGQGRSSGSKAGDLAAELPADARRLAIGDAAPDFSLQGIDGKTYSLANFKEARVLMVVFLSNHCPYSHAAETRLLPFAAEVKSRGVSVVAINPNSPDAVSVSELGYSKYNDSYDEMKLYAKEQGFTFPYLYDGDTQATAKAYGCLCTPHVFVFDADRRLRYSGRLDDSRLADPGTVKAPDARNAVESLLAGKAVPVESTKLMGCATKWIEQKAEVVEADRKWDDTPVTLETIDAAGVSKLAKNGSNKVRLINVWATWCGPCVSEFPVLVATSRRFANRDFELVTLSVDHPKTQPAVKGFLEKQHAAVPNRVQRSLKSEGRRTNNYLFTGDDLGQMLQALDSEAPGPVPYTLLIAPGGKVLYRHAGAVDAAELQAKVLDALGAYYTDSTKVRASRGG
jgi:peroxiredoxin